MHMNSDGLKQSIITSIRKTPRKFVPFESLTAMGYNRYMCSVCKKNFWSVNKRDTCGDVECTGDYSFLYKRISASKMRYQEIWTRFSKVFSKFGHKEIKRYPVVARWRDDIFFVEAAIDDFAPYVINGEAEPPANPLVIPQICLRFNDIENIGLSGRHLTSFIMAEEAAFNTKKKKTYFADEAIKYINTWLIDGLYIKQDELTYVEDAWVGAGYAGNSLEFFAGGLELGNQVYMRYKLEANGMKDLPTKTIDMGAGLERWAWLSGGTPTVYEAAFPRVIELIKNKAGIDYKEEQIKSIYRLTGRTDFNSVPLSSVIKEIAGKLNAKEDAVAKILRRMQAVYSVADHARTILVSVHDGALPSNVGGGYNIRRLIRRSLNLIERNELGVDLNELIEEHKREFGGWFRELNDYDINGVMDKETGRYSEFKQRNSKLLSSLVEGGAISNDKIRTLYESHGITREEIKAKAEEMGAEIKLPPEELEEINRRRTPRGPGIGVDTTNIKETEKLFYNEGLLETSAKMVKKLDAHRIILNKTIFYPEMGGQKPDGGYIDSVKVNDVRIYDGVIVHFLDSEIKKGIGDTVKLKIDSERRELLRRHHTATHIINRAAKKILGEFVNQAGAEKDVDSARLDITYYDKLSDEQLLAIERLANDVVASDMEISSEVMGRTEAESRYGMNIYQGGTAPSANIRIVKIGSYDAEACGGLHCNRTGQVGLIKIMKSERIQDGVVRLEFAAYRPAIAYVQSLDETARSLSRLWGVKYEEIYKTANRFFSDYKRYRELYERAEEERLYYNIIKSDQKDPIALRTDVENAGVMIKVLKNAQKAPGERAVVISGKSISVGYPKSDNIRALLTKEHKVVEDKGDFLLSHD